MSHKEAFSIILIGQVIGFATGISKKLVFIHISYTKNYKLLKCHTLYRDETGLSKGIALLNLLSDRID